MMILGISGCTALLLTGFGIKDSVTNVADMQYGEVQTYDIGITYSDRIQDSDREEMLQKAGDLLAQTTYHHEESVELEFGGKVKSIYLEVPEDVEEMGTFLNLHTTAGESIAYPGEGEAVLTEKVAKNLGIRVGDQVVFRDNDRNSFTVRIAGLCENFVYNYIYVNKETYTGQMGVEPEYKSAYTLVQDGVDVHEAAAVLSDMDNVLAVSVTVDMRQRIATMMESMDYIVFLIIACAGCLAFIVLYNLTNINITERIREIATIKVLGFYARETADYVFRENLVLTAMGAVVGLILGKGLHSFVMYEINIDMISFKTMVAPLSYLWSLLLTFVFAMLVNGVMYFKLEKINMAESLKSIE
ncbi:ABC transporter permease [Bacteroides congonensis]|uniref:ABC transporter permease n=1 Tax=Bacteroides congonensis TaxID=1871006 RepID=UPI00321A7C59